jgi:hypothetical protein
MIDGVEDIYQRIADAIVAAIPEPWQSAKAEAIFFENNINFIGEYVSEAGKERDFAVPLYARRAFQELRRKFKEANQPLWGQASFELCPDGKFSLKWGYDHCDENGNTIWDDVEWGRMQSERHKRLTQP